MSGQIVSIKESRSYRYRVTDVLITVKAGTVHHPIICQLLKKHKISFDVRMLLITQYVTYSFIVYSFICTKAIAEVIKLLQVSNTIATVHSACRRLLMH